MSNQEIKEYYNKIIEENKKNNFNKLHETASTVNKVYTLNQNQTKINDVKQNIENYIIKNGIEQIDNNIDNNLNNHKIEKLDEEGLPINNVVTNRRKNNLFIRKI